jgi:hypothetical protein
MAVRLVQSCDRCKTERDLPPRGPQDTGGWRKVAVRGDFGISRDEQPWLCPACLTAVWSFIQFGPTVEVIVPPRNSDERPTSYRFDPVDEKRG